MSNALDATGLTIDSPAETRDKFLNGTMTYPGMRQIYGADINVAPNSPDGQFVDIGVQFTQDMLEFLQQIFTSMDPDQAVGRVLDMRCTINGVVRKAGTKTVTPVSVTVTQAVTLAGLDTDPVNPFTVADTAGNQYQLIASHAFVAAGTASLSFQCSVLGEITPLLNTITTIVTVTLGVASVNNPALPTTIGTAEESDFSLRIRRQKSVALPSKGFFDGLYGALVDIDGVTSVNLLENTTNTTDINGIPGHSIWAIVAGGTNDAVARAIYVKRNAGCGMKGATAVNITQVDGSIFTVQFDRPTSETLWIKLSVHAITGTVDTAYIEAQIAARLSYNIGQTAVVSDIITLVQSIAPNAAISETQISNDDVTYVTDFLDPTGVNYQFAVDAARITVSEI